MWATEDGAQGLGAALSHTQSPGSPGAPKWPPRKTALEGWLWVGRPLLDIRESVFLTAFFSPYLLSLH